MSTRSIDFSVIVPAYNEEQRIVPTLRALDDFFATSSLSYEIVVVDDGSSDGTTRVVAAEALERPAIRLIGTTPNRGKGHAVRIGMLSAGGEMRMMFDADGSMPVTEIPKLWAPLARGEAEVAIGSRYAVGAVTNETQPGWRRAWSRLCNWFIRRTIVAGVADTQCGFKVFSAGAAEALFSRATIDGWAFDLEILAVADRMGLRIAEIPVAWTDDGRSRVSPVRDLARVLGEWLTIQRNLRRGRYLLAAA